MKYLGQRSLSKMLQVALTVVYRIAEAAVVVIVLAIGLRLVSAKLPAPTRLQVQTPNLVITLSAPLQSGAGRIWFLLMLGTVTLPLMLTLLYVVRLLRQIFATLVEDRPFLAENAGRVRRIGVAILVLAFVQWVGELLSGTYIARHVHLEGVSFMVRLNPDLTMIFFGFLVLILAEVFRRGAQLQEDNDLTV